MSKLDFIYARHSVRDFTDEEVDMNDVKEIIKAATYAPSGKNKQNWHFVVVKNKEIINNIAKAIEDKGNSLIDGLENQEMKNSFLKFLPFYSFFTKAPITILVFASEYENTGLNILKEKNAPEEEINKLNKANPGIQNIGAAMQNLLLSASALGYGTCWMTGPNFASEEIEKVIGLEKEGFYLAAMTPLGVPKGNLKSPKRKGLDEVMTILD